MNKKIELRLDGTGRGAFIIENDGDQVAEMEISIREGNLTVFHTQVADSLKGQGVASKMLTAMVAHARQNNLKVIPLCPFVHAQFKKNPESYQDIWNKTWHQKQPNGLSK